MARRSKAQSNRMAIVTVSGKPLVVTCPGCGNDCKVMLAHDIGLVTQLHGDNKECLPRNIFHTFNKPENYEQAAIRKRIEEKDND